MDRSFNEQVFSFILGKHLGVELLGCQVDVGLIPKRLLNHSPKGWGWIYEWVDG